MANVHSKVFSLIDHTITGLQKVSQSLTGGGAMSMFRQALRRTLTRRLRLIYKMPDAAAQKFKEMILDELCGQDIAFAPLRAVLGKFASGDWSNREHFEFLVAHGERRVDVLKQLFTHLVPALAGHVPFCFPRHRWTGTDKALRDIGLLESVHGLLGHAYQEFMHMIDAAFGKPSGRRADDLESALVDGVDDGGNEAEVDAENPSAEAKKHFRGIAYDWIRELTAGRDIIVAAVALKPMSFHMGSQIKYSSALWLSQQETQRLSLATTEGVRAVFKSSSWPIMIAADMELDREALYMLSELQQLARYSEWPVLWHTVETQNMLFRMFSRQGCAIKENFIARHRAFPFRLFRLLRHDDAEADVLSSCPPSRDAYTSSFMAAFEGELSSPQALAELALIATAARTSTVTL